MTTNNNRLLPFPYQSLWDESRVKSCLHDNERMIVLMGAEPVFPVDVIHDKLEQRNGLLGIQTEMEASVFLTGVIEYLVDEVCKLYNSVQIFHALVLSNAVPPSS